MTQRRANPVRLFCACLFGALMLLALNGWGEPAPDLATPRRSVDGFLRVARAANFTHAAQYLDLRNLSRAQQTKEGPLLAEKLAYVVTRRLLVDLAKLPDDLDEEPVGKGETGKTIALGTLYVHEEPIAIALQRVRWEDGSSRWLLSKGTVASIPAVYDAFGPRGWEDHIPEVLTQYTFLGNEIWQWIGLLGGGMVGYLLGHLIATVIVSGGGRFARSSRLLPEGSPAHKSRRPLRMFFGFLFFRLLIESLQLTAGVYHTASRIAHTFLVIALGWIVLRGLDIATEWAQGSLPNDTLHELKSRGFRTQLLLLRRVSTVLVVFVGTALVLMQFETVRNVGVSLLASAGLAGVVLGLAAQKSLGGVIAGIQLLITQPVRIGDAVVVEGEFGQVEEINLTYVLVRIWDQRRLVVPIARFLDQPFQNWTRVGPEIMGVANIPVDYLTPVDQVRAELVRLCKENQGWDGRVCELSVHDLTEKCMILRALVSSANAAKNGALRNEIREGLMIFLRELDGGKYMPKNR